MASLNTYGSLLRNWCKYLSSIISNHIDYTIKKKSRYRFHRMYTTWFELINKDLTHKNRFEFVSNFSHFLTSDGMDARYTPTKFLVFKVLIEICISSIKCIHCHFLSCVIQIYLCARARVSVCIYTCSHFA